MGRPGDMRIAQVTLRYDAPGGVETTVQKLSRGLQARGEDVEVFASDLVDESGWVRRADFPPTVDGIPVHRFAAIKQPVPGLSLPYLAGLAGALVDSRPDLIHAHSHRYGHVLQATAVARRRRLPIVISTHYHPADVHEPALKKRLLRVEDYLFGFASYRDADALVVESELERSLVREFDFGGPVRVIPPGIDLEEWQDPAADQPEGLHLPEEYFLFVGRIARNKGLAFLFDALARVPTSERLPLVLVGPDWGERAELGARARRLDIDEAVRWFGPYPDRRTYRAILRRACALVLPSEWEAYGLVLLDAMAARTPIVATEVGAVPEVLERGRAGRLVPYGDFEVLASALRDVRGNPGRTHELVARGAEKVQECDWSVAVERHLALYRELEENRSRGTTA